MAGEALVSRPLAAATPSCFGADREAVTSAIGEAAAEEAFAEGVVGVLTSLAFAAGGTAIVTTGFSGVFDSEALSKGKKKHSDQDIE